MFKLILPYFVRRSYPARDVIVGPQRTGHQVTHSHTGHTGQNIKMGGNGKLLFVSNVWGVALMLGGPRQDIALRIFWSIGAFSVQSFAIQGCSFALLPLLLSLPLLPLLPNCIAGKLILSSQKCYLTFLHLTHRIKQRNAYKYTNTRAVIPKIVQVQYLKGITLSAQTDFLDLTFTPDPDKTERCSYTFYFYHAGYSCYKFLDSVHLT